MITPKQQKLHDLSLLLGASFAQAYAIAGGMSDKAHEILEIYRDSRRSLSIQPNERPNTYEAYCTTQGSTSELPNHMLGL